MMYINSRAYWAYFKTRHVGIIRNFNQEIPVIQEKGHHKAPDNLTQFPENVTWFPKNVTRFPDIVTKFPENCTPFPKKV